MAPPVSTGLDVENSIGPHDAGCGARLPDDDMNPGRAKRCLMMSYLC
jgi:hypothetical protein